MKAEIQKLQEWKRLNSSASPSDKFEAMRIASERSQDFNFLANTYMRVASDMKAKGSFNNMFRMRAVRCAHASNQIIQSQITNLFI
jgi:hypothetical protein